MSEQEIHDYLVKIGRKGGKASKRELSSADAKAMARRFWASPEGNARRKAKTLRKRPEKEKQ